MIRTVEIVFGAFFLAVLFVVGLIVAAIILRATISLFNWLSADSNPRSPVPEPTLPQAMGICFLMILLNGGIGFLVSFLAANAQDSSVQPGPIAPIVPLLISLAINFAINTALFTGLLPTSADRAIPLTMLHFLISIAIGIVLAGVGYVLLTFT
jgi:hypothetical protein